MKSRSYLYCALATTLNIILNALTLGNYLWLEGRVRDGFFKNWAHRFGYRPINFVQPETEEEIVALVKSAGKIRFFGSGHSFNAGVVSDETLVSIDKYAGLVKKDGNRVTVKGGTRMRDVVALLLENGLAFEALPSHDAQSIGGILSTNVHGTGRDWGFVAETVTRLKIIDGTGEIHECTPLDDLFRAAIGGIGAVGIISEVTVEAVERFNVEQKFELLDYDFVKTNLDTLLANNKHLSLYLFPFADKCQVSTWNPTEKPKSFLNELREFIAISFDALSSAWFGNLMAYTGFLPRSNCTYGFKRGTDLVMESNKAYNRTIYHLHQELEFTVPFEETWEMCERFLRLYEDMYSKEMPYTLLEIRFTPAGHDNTLIGAGHDRHSTWIDLICNDSHGFEKYYAAAEEIIKEIGARPHLGKYCRTLDKAHLSNVHEVNLDRFLELMREFDPEDKFANNFTRRMFRD
jgi:FAD/FMN-containing dehydrogenase